MYKSSPNPTFLRKVLFWLGFLSLLSGFTYLEARLLILGTVGTVILVMLFLVELAAIFIWNALVG